MGIEPCTLGFKYMFNQFSLPIKLVTTAIFSIPSLVAFLSSVRIEPCILRFKYKYRWPIKIGPLAGH
jgi:hypothetical protein